MRNINWVYDRSDLDHSRHERERVEQGFSEYDWWNFDDYLAAVNIAGLEKFKTGHGYPGGLSSMDDWVHELDIMIDGFKAHLKLSDMDYDFKDEEAKRLLVETRDKGLALYAKRFASLWD